MIVLKIFLSAILFTFNCKNANDRNIMIIGKALNEKSGAVIISNENVMYFVDGYDYWGKKYYGKKIKVTGVLVTKNLKKNTDTTVIIQEMVGIKRTIKNPKVTLLE